MLQFFNRIGFINIEINDISLESFVPGIDARLRQINNFLIGYARRAKKKIFFILTQCKYFEKTQKPKIENYYDMNK